MGSMRALWNQLQSSLWLVPSLLIAAGTGLAFLLLEIDNRVSVQLQEAFPRFLGAGAEGTRGLLSTIAASMIGIAGVTFSITIVSLALAATQYTPRILRNFMRDRTNQLVLGTFVGIFVYCLIVLRSIRGGDNPFIPVVSVTFGLALAVVGAFAFMYFLHHTATTLQASTILARVAEETRNALRHRFLTSQAPTGELSEEERHDRDKGDWTPLPATRSGYVQNLDEDKLVNIAARRGPLKIHHGVGDFVQQDAPLVSYRGDPPSEAETQEIRRCFGIAFYRSVEQDPAFGIRQIVDVAVKAMSPGINDPTTAKTCVDFLGTILYTLVQCRFPSEARYKDRARVAFIPGTTFEALVGQAFNEIRQTAAHSPSVVLRMLAIIRRVAPYATRPGQKRVLAEQARMIGAHARKVMAFPPDRKLVQSVVKDVAMVLE
jgi:uncharacterized membrane protein